MVRLQVKRAYEQDVGRGIVRLPSWVFGELGIEIGDYVLIRGEKEVVARAFRLDPLDERRNPDVIRMDGELRKNAKTSVDEVVDVEKAEVKPAKKVILALASKSPQAKQLVKEINQNRELLEYIMENLRGRGVVEGNLINVYIPISYFEALEIPFVVAQTTPKGPVYITSDTTITFSERAPEEIRRSTGVTYEDIGGLKKEIQLIREMVELPLKHPEVFKRLGIEPPKGVLLYGPPGCGKTLLAKAVANEADAYFIAVNGPEIVSKYYGESEQNLRRIFEEAQKNAPAIIFFDEIDAIAPKREEARGEVERRLVAQLLTLMDGLKSRGDVIVIAATNRPEDIDPALRRPGRFDREIEIGLPNRQGRKEILLIHTRRMPLDVYYSVNAVKEVLKELSEKDEEVRKIYERVKNLSKLDEIKKVVTELGEDKRKRVEYKLKEKMMEELADKTHGYTGADLAALAKEAAMNALRRMLPEIKKSGDEPVPEETLKNLVVTYEDFLEALKRVEPSAMREVMVEVPRVRWSDIGGLEKVKQELREAIEWPMKYPKLFEEAGIEPPKGVLLYGPPGCGKTLLAKAVATESNAHFIPVRGPEILSKWVGESEKAIRKIFHKARQVAPSVIFFDEIDAIAPQRGTDVNRVTERIVAQILTEMDGIQELKDVVVIAATNRPDLIDPALLRPGRFERLIYVPPPDFEARKEIFKVHTRRMKLGKDVDLEELARRTEGYTGADIAAVCREAGMEAIREAIREGKESIGEVRMKHFLKALERVKPSLSKEELERWEKLHQKMSRGVQ